MTKEELIPYIKEKIKNNTSGDITGNVLQEVLEEIVNQDYIKAVATLGRAVAADCNVLSVLANALEAGTLFDVIVVYDDGGDLCQSKILGHDGGTLFFYHSLDTVITNFDVVYSPAQYAALSAVQLEVDRIDEVVYQHIPELIITKGFLFDNGSGYDICNPDGYKYAATAADGKIASISVSDELSVGDKIVINEETAQDLIGLPLN